MKTYVTHKFVYSKVEQRKCTMFEHSQSQKAEDTEKIEDIAKRCTAMGNAPAATHGQVSGTTAAAVTHHNRQSRNGPEASESQFLQKKGGASLQQNSMHQIYLFLL